MEFKTVNCVYLSHLICLDVNEIKSESLDLSLSGFKSVNVGFGPFWDQMRLKLECEMKFRTVRCVYLSHLICLD